MYSVLEKMIHPDSSVAFKVTGEEIEGYVLRVLPEPASGEGGTRTRVCV